ncbi:MAG TPA: SemiSWEET family transporter [Gaiellaceae bacterium]|jgi:uncharacterized protein with PQ loop repeat
MLSFVAAIATVSALASGSLPAIQIAKLWHDRNSDGISLVWVVGALTNSIVWNVYGLLLGNLTLILPNALSLLMNVTMTGVVFAVRHPRFTGNARNAIAHPVAHFAKAVVDDPELAAEFAALVSEHEADRFAAAETLVLPPGDVRLGFA